MCVCGGGGAESDVRVCLVQAGIDNIKFENFQKNILDFWMDGWQVKLLKQKFIMHLVSLLISDPKSFASNLNK